MYGTYSCYVDGTEVGTINADGSFEAREKAKKFFGDKAESEWNARKIMSDEFH